MKNARYEDIPMLWGVFSVHLNGDKEVTRMAFAHQAFKYFPLKFDATKKWLYHKGLFQKYFEKPESVGKKVRLLIRVYHGKYEKQFKVMYLCDIDKFTN